MSTDTLAAATHLAPARLPDISTLQQITEEAVGHRERGASVATELFVPAVILAQKVAEQLAAYGYCGEAVWVGKKEADRRRYDVLAVKWKTGRLGRRTKHTGAVIVRDFTGSGGRLLFDPTRPDRQWLQPGQDTWVAKMDLPLQDNPFNQWEMATAADLADWAHDAQRVVEIIRDCERLDAEHLESGLQVAEQALAVL